jgi:Tfp pilus assembly protein PilE
MIHEAIRAPIRWWAKHPWKTFWGFFLFYFVIVFPLFMLFVPDPQPGTLLNDLLGYLFIIYLLLSAIVLFLSFIRGMFLIWQRSKIEAFVIAVIIAVPSWVIVEMFSAVRTREYDADVKSNIRNAAVAQEAFFTDNSSYTNAISNLKEYGYIQSSNVLISVESAATTYLITGTMTKGCKANTGTWYLINTTDTIDGTPCR